MNHITVRDYLIYAMYQDVEWQNQIQRRLKLENIIVDLTHPLFMYNSKQKYSHCEGVCLHVSVSVWVGRGGLGKKFGLGLYA